MLYPEDSDHSVYGYLTRRSDEELKLVISLCDTAQGDDCNEYRKMAEQILRERHSGQAIVNE